MVKVSLFYDKLKEDRQHSRFNSVSMDKDKYLKLISKVKSVKTKTKKEGNDYKFLKRYDVVAVNGISRLIYPIKESGILKYFICDEELFDVLNDAHNTTNHGGRDRMIKYLRKKYVNVTYRDVQTFVNLCEACKCKQKNKHKIVDVKPILFKELNSRCQVDLIDFQSQPDGDYRFILNYQDHLTKFVILKPLKSKTTDEVCSNIIDIFTLFGAPSILQSDNGEEFVDKIMDSLTNFWPNFKIVHGKARHNQNEGANNQNVEKMLTTWMQKNNTSNWVQGLKFVQFTMNSSFYSGIKRTPYEAMFGCSPKQGLASPNIPLETLELIESEEDLENALGYTSNQQDFVKTDFIHVEMS